MGVGENDSTPSQYRTKKCSIFRQVERKRFQSLHCIFSIAEEILLAIKIHEEAPLFVLMGYKGVRDFVAFRVQLKRYGVGYLFVYLP